MKFWLSVLLGVILVVIALFIILTVALKLWFWMMAGLFAFIGDIFILGALAWGVHWIWKRGEEMFDGE